LTVQIVKLRKIRGTNDTRSSSDEPQAVRDCGRLAVTITASVQLVGVFLVFTSLIVPYLAAHAAPRHLRLAAGYVVGLTGYVLGLLAAANFDFPTGAASSACSPLLALPPQWC
jgi:ABC-type Mn2+/Zn2+ transport system permease subunit